MQFAETTLEDKKKIFRIRNFHYKFQKADKYKKNHKNLKNLPNIITECSGILYNPFLLHDSVCWIKPYLKLTTSGLFC